MSAQGPLTATNTVQKDGLDWPYYLSLLNQVEPPTANGGVGAPPPMWFPSGPVVRSNLGHLFALGMALSAIPKACNRSQTRYLSVATATTGRLRAPLGSEPCTDQLAGVPVIGFHPFQLAQECAGFDPSTVSCEVSWGLLGPHA